MSEPAEKRENSDFAIKLYQKKENIREYIAEETLHRWRQVGVMPLGAEHYRAKERLMECLQDIGI